MEVKDEIKAQPSDMEQKPAQVSAAERTEVPSEVKDSYGFKQMIRFDLAAANSQAHSHLKSLTEKYA